MVLIIGATGFIGMYTTQAFLKAGKQVIATGRNEALGRKLEEMGAEFLPLDITKKEDFDKLICLFFVLGQLIFPIFHRFLLESIHKSGYFFDFSKEALQHLPLKQTQRPFPYI